MALAEYAAERGYWSQARPRAAIVGGWAVYAYNAYSGSIDIDLVGARAVCKSIAHHMVTDRGFGARIQPYPGFEGIELPTQNGPVYLDMGRFGDPYPFEGRGGDFPFQILERRNERLNVEGVEFLGPERTTLLMFKLKAAWDRATRIERGTSPNPGHERTKLVKDRGDILAILDASRGVLDARYARSVLDDYPFLKDVLDATAQDADAHAFYLTDASTAHDRVARFRALVGIEE